MSAEITAAAMRKLAEPHCIPVTHERREALRQAADALEASQARIAAYECLQQSTQTRVRELEAEVTEGVQAREQMLTEILPLRNLYKASLKLRNHLRGVDGQDKPYLVEFREALDEAWKVSKP